MRLLLKTVFILSLFNQVFAQDTITKYFNGNWTEISDKNQATYYRKAFLDSSKVWIVHDYFMSNNIQMIGAFKSKKFNTRQGHFTYFYENGKKASEGECINDKNEGFWTYWYENGQKKSAGKFKNNLRQDKWTFWHENGRIKSEGLYVDGNEENKWTYWYDSGEKLSEGACLHGDKDGIWEYYYKTGKLETVEKYKAGQLDFITGYFENGNIWCKGNCINGLIDGEWTYWNVDGRMTFKGSYSKSLKEGEWIRFFPDGTTMKIYFVKGVLVSKQLGGIVDNE